MVDPLPYCLYLLKRRPYSRFELDRAMQRRDVGDAERAAALARLESLGLVDDRAFAAAWIRTRDLLAPRGKHLLRAELAKKGLDKEIIDQALSRAVEAEPEADERPSEETLARTLLEGKKRLYAGLAPEVRKRRLLGLLQRRGFSYDTIRRILDS